VIVSDGEDVLANLRTERQSLRSELERVNADIRATRMFTSETSGYEREAKEQRARLSAIELIRSPEIMSLSAPSCASVLQTAPPTVSNISQSLQELHEQLVAVEAENPRLQLRLANLMREESLIEERLRENQISISARQRENEILRVQQDTFILQARTIGKVTQYLENRRGWGCKLRLEDVDQFVDILWKTGFISGFNSAERRPVLLTCPRKSLPGPTGVFS
jgi:hypothetical protein